MFSFNDYLTWSNMKLNKARHYYYETHYMYVVTYSAISTKTMAQHKSTARIILNWELWLYLRACSLSTPYARFGIGLWVDIHCLADPWYYSVSKPGASWGFGGRNPQILGWRGRGGSWGSQVGSWGIVKYYYILSCTGSMFESGDF